MNRHRGTCCICTISRASTTQDIGRKNLTINHCVALYIKTFLHNASSFLVEYVKNFNKLSVFTMVRVLSVYHFLGQKTKTIEDIVDSCLIQNNRLVLAKRNGFIEIFDLNDDTDDCCACFATIDDVVTVEYSIQGNYLVCLEEKLSKGKCVKSVRVYCHFEAAGQDTNLGIKARIAGKTTPIYSTSETRCLEMLEIPLKQVPEIVACCQVRKVTFPLYIFIGCENIRNDRMSSSLTSSRTLFVLHFLSYSNMNNVHIVSMNSSYNTL